MHNYKRKGGRIPRERLGERQIQIFHPACGSVILLLHLSLYRQRLAARGICHTCGTYVHLVYEGEK